MSGRVAVEGTTCWHGGQSGRVAFLVDAESYFAAVASACEKARESILVAGWAIDSRVRLRRDEAPSDLPAELGPFLAALGKRHRSLRIRVLAWDFAMLFGLESGFLPVFRAEAEQRRRVQWELDSEHALGAAQHQKVVVVDDRVAFVSGMDLTSERWDTRAHAPADPRRVDAGRAYGPYHDVAMVFDGPPARHVARLLRSRWKSATGRAVPLARFRARVRGLEPGSPIGDAIDRAGDLAERLEERTRTQLRRLLPPSESPSDPWPDGVAPDARDATVALARTEAAYLWTPAVREVEALWVAAIAAARRCIYVENQYFTSKVIADALVRRLAEEDGPEVVLVLPASCPGWLEKVTMGVLRDVELRVLHAADAHGRLRVLHPVASDGSPIQVHSKVLIVDDVLARVGSANASNRSLSLDTELDAVLEAAGREDLAAAIARLRDDLVAEHLGTEAARVKAETAERGSLGAAIGALAGEGRSLRPLAVDSPPWLASLVPTGLADPERTERAEALQAQLAPIGPRPATRAQVTRSVALTGLLALLTVGWALIPVGAGARTLAELATPWATSPAAPVLAALGFVLLGLVAFPMSVLVLASELAFGPIVGSLVSLVGGIASSLVAYVQGRVIGRRWLRKLGGSRVNRASRALARHGVATIAAARLMPLVPWTLTSMLAGASHVRPLDYVIGTVLGLVPGVLAAALVTDATTALGMRGAVELALFAALAASAFAWARARLRRTVGPP